MRDEDQVRAWTIDYAPRLHPKDDVVSPETVIAEARKFARYITGAAPAKRLKLVQPKPNPNRK